MHWCIIICKEEYFQRLHSSVCYSIWPIITPCPPSHTLVCPTFFSLSLHPSLLVIFHLFLSYSFPLSVLFSLPQVTSGKWNPSPAFPLSLLFVLLCLSRFQSTPLCRLISVCLSVPLVPRYLSSVSSSVSLPSAAAFHSCSNPYKSPSIALISSPVFRKCELIFSLWICILCFSFFFSVWGSNTGSMSLISLSLNPFLFAFSFSFHRLSPLLLSPSLFRSITALHLDPPSSSLSLSPHLSLSTCWSSLSESRPIWGRLHSTEKDDVIPLSAAGQDWRYYTAR